MWQEQRVKELEAQIEKIKRYLEDAEETEGTMNIVLKQCKQRADNQEV